jgi:hypothetical protein
MLSNGSLSPVFNIRGMWENGSSGYNKFNVYEENNRNYITYSEDTGIIY